MLMVFVVIPRQAVRHLIIMVVIGKIPLSQRNKNQILQKTSEAAPFLCAVAKRLLICV